VHAVVCGCGETFRLSDLRIGWGSCKNKGYACEMVSTADDIEAARHDEQTSDAMWGNETHCAYCSRQDTWGFGTSL
jgi:hypothetical protein